MVATGARLAGALPPGVHHLHQVMTLAEVPGGQEIELGFAPGPAERR